MFALRPSLFRSSAFLSRRLASSSTTVLDFLADSDPDAPPGPTFFPEAPPVATPDGYPPAQHTPAFTRQTVDKATRPVYHLHCHSSRNNTIVTFTEPNGGTIDWLSGGSTPSKFRKANRASYEAGYQCAIGIFNSIQKHMQVVGPIQLHLFFKGFGEGREAMKTALLATEGEAIRKLVCTITDRTPIKIGGTRSKKQRRG